MVALSLGLVVVTTCFVGALCLSAGIGGTVFGELSAVFMLIGRVVHMVFVSYLLPAEHR